MKNILQGKTTYDNAGINGILLKKHILKKRKIEYFQDLK
jgi:hypothetical protein